MTGADEPGPLPGLQQERTALAWDRTGLALIVTGALLVRAGGVPYLHARHVVGYLVAAFGGLLLLVEQRRYTRRASAQATVSPGLTRATGAAAVIAGVAAFVLILTEL